MENNEWIWHFREERERNGISRKSVAAVAGISREYLCRLETGKLPVTDKARKQLTAALKTLYPDPLNLMMLPELSHKRGTNPMEQMLSGTELAENDRKFIEQQMQDVGEVVIMRE